MFFKASKYIDKESYEEIHVKKSEIHGLNEDEIEESYTKIKHSHPKSRPYSKKG